MKLVMPQSRLLTAMMVLTAVLMVLLAGCARERISDQPPIHLNPNMDSQPKYKSQAESRFFSDGATMRLPVAGTVARGELREDDGFFLGKTADGSFLKTAPVEVTIQLLERGQERYDIYCSPCHGRTGDGRGIVVTRGYVPPPTFHSDRIRDLPDGQVYDVISNGVRNMPAYRYQIQPKDRWAIVSYLKALQRSRNATINDIPIEMRETIK
jgi:mono/diheme cytochrome c family protein